MEDHIACDSTYPMWEKYQRLTVNGQHGIVFNKNWDLPQWFGVCSDAVIAPLYRRRPILLGIEHRLHAWTLYRKENGTQGWVTPREDNDSLHFPIEINAKKPANWYFTIPPEIRRKAWLPEASGIVMVEFNDAEVSIWTQDAYNIESFLEAESG